MRSLLLQVVVMLAMAASANAQTVRSEWRSQYELKMKANSRTQAAMDANEAAMESVWSQLKTRKGRIQLAGEGYWIRNPITSYALDGQSLFGVGGIGLYNGENLFAGGVNSATGGSYSRIHAGAEGMPSLLDITGYGWRIQDVSFMGTWRQAYGDANAITDWPTTGILIRSSPASVTDPTSVTTSFGTGKMIFDGLCFYALDNGITFGGSNPAPGLPSENNADNAHFTRTEGQFLTEAIYRFKSAQSVVFTMEQTHSYHCSQVAYFERGGHADLGFIEVVSGPTSGARAGLGTIVLHIGDTRENENWYRFHARLDNTAKKPGLKVVQIDTPAFGTIINCSTSFGYAFNNTAPSPPTDIYDIKGATSLILSGGPFYEDCIKCVDSGSRDPHITFLPGTTFHTGVTPDECVNTATSTGDWSMKWYGCCDINGQPIVDGSATD